IFGTRVLVAHENRDRRAERFAFEHTRENFAAVFLFALGGDFALTRTTTVQLKLDVLLANVDLGRTAIDDNADPTAVRFAKRGDSKKLAECIAHQWKIASVAVSASRLPTAGTSKFPVPRFQIASSAAFRSSIKSRTSSTPTDNRTSESPMPSSSRCSFGTEACVMSTG